MQFPTSAWRLFDAPWVKDFRFLILPYSSAMRIRALLPKQKPLSIPFSLFLSLRLACFPLLAVLVVVIVAKVEIDVAVATWTIACITTQGCK